LEGEGNGNYRNATIPITIPGSIPGNYEKSHPAMVIPLNPEGIGIGEWVIFFSENFEGMGMGNLEKLCA